MYHKSLFYKQLQHSTATTLQKDRFYKAKGQILRGKRTGMAMRKYPFCKSDPVNTPFGLSFLAGHDTFRSGLGCFFLSLDLMYAISQISSPKHIYNKVQLPYSSPHRWHS